MKNTPISQNLIASGRSIHDWSSSIKYFEADVFTFLIAVQPQDNDITSFSLQHSQTLFTHKHLCFAHS